ncbi:MAG: D-tyrosyl-tRNA(Tyr) deacylase [Herpetosiphonaceae bacterium]|nr:D-tyrosyl-tRNA(Tyr) deacylase [Herpetosiphonaceae bacterium]
MRAVIQRVREAQVVVEQTVVGAIGPGLLVFLAVTHTDSAAEARRLADKIIGLRIFPDQSGRFDQALAETGGGLLVVSQFTLYGDTRKGRRPSFTASAQPDHAAPLIDVFVEHAQTAGIPTTCGVFGAQMDVHLLNDGPVTLILDTADWSAKRG